ncbi:hypothetical protein AGMMS50230_19260 [Spirochaetia bacterium]|nr:hypothetical protein AGMMS50230_19260 [Spirochaetia bacterium]
MISAGDPLLEDLRAVVREAGSSFLSLTPPLSSDEVMAVLDEIDSGALSESGRRRYQRILDNMVPVLRYQSESPAFAVAVHVNAALEGRWRSNTSVPWLKQDTTSPALIGLPVHLFFGKRVELFIEPEAAADPWYYNNPVSSWGTNVPWEARRFDLNVPLRAFAATGGEWWNFQLGRDKLSFGPGRTGNLAVSDNPDYYDFARLSFFSRVLKYSILVTQMPLSVDELLADASLLPGLKAVSDLTETTNRYFYLHRLDMKFFKKLSIGLSEGVMVGNSPLELRYLNPLMVFHSFFSWRDYGQWGTDEGDLIGSLFSLDLEWAFRPGWALYGQVVMNEFSTPYETNRFPDQPPPGMGYLLGAEYQFSLASWSVSCYAELVYTDPFLYTLSSPFGSMIWMRRSSDLGNKDLRYAWFGHGEGRDMFLAALGFSADSAKCFLSMDISFKRQGEHTILWDWTRTDNSQKSPSGNPETLGRLILGAGYRVFPSLTLSSWLGGTLIFDAGHIRGNNEQGIEAGLKAAYHY